MLYSFAYLKQIIDFPTSPSTGKNYIKHGQGSVGINYFYRVQKGWVKDEKYWLVDSDNIDCTIDSPQAVPHAGSHSRKVMSFNEYPL